MGHAITGVMTKLHQFDVD